MTNNAMRISEEFCSEWQKLLSPFFKSDKNFIVVENLMRQKAAVCLPYLNYTNLTKEQLPELLKYIGDKYDAYNIRLLDFDYKNFRENDTVTLRTELENNATFVWEKIISSKARNHIKKAEKSGVVVSNGKTKKLLDDFFLLYKKTMKIYGTPILSRNIFLNILENISAEIYVAYVNSIPASALFITYDGALAWVPWSASDRRFNSLCSTNLVYWYAIRNACTSGINIFDFGRSPYGGQTYMFKKQWGTYPVKISIITNNDDNVYSKYRTASAIWKILPQFITDSIGPFLSKHLTDL